jgi:hypothetical protein
MNATAANLIERVSPLHAATRAGALDPAGREALLRRVLRPPVAQERVPLRYGIDVDERLS